MIPRVRLKYVQGLEAAHEDLRLPRDVDLTTDGACLIVSSTASGRPLVKVPQATVQRIEVAAANGLISPANKVAGGLAGTERVLVVEVGAAPSVPPAIAGHPIVFAAPDEKDVAPRADLVRNLLVPRTREEMARLERGDRRMHLYFGMGFFAIIALILALIVALFLLVAAPRQQQGNAVPAQLAALVL